VTLFQLGLLITAGVIFYLFFRQIFSGDYPRSEEFGREGSDESRAFPGVPQAPYGGAREGKSRLETLLEMADEALERGDNLEAKKALTSALILDDRHPEVLRRLGAVYLNMNDYPDARETLERLLEVDPSDDLAHALLANTLHKLGEDEEAIAHHLKAIRLDPDYAPHHFNYANTLYDLGRKEEALAEYQKALELDPGLEEARKMIKELEHE